MRPLDKLKLLFSRNKQPQITSSDVTPYYTSLVYIPKYKALSDEEKAQVDKYIAQTNISRIEDLITYGKELNKYSTSLLDLLLNLYYNITEENLGKNLSQEEMLKIRINKLIENEQISIYKEKLQKIERETMLRTVSLEEIYKRWKMSFRAKDLFDEAERLHRRYMGEQFKYAIERMKISKKTVEEQLQVVLNTSMSNRNACKCYRSIQSCT